MKLNLLILFSCLYLPSYSQTSYVVKVVDSLPCINQYLIVLQHNSSVYSVLSPYNSMAVTKGTILQKGMTVKLKLNEIAEKDDPTKELFAGFNKEKPTLFLTEEELIQKHIYYSSRCLKGKMLVHNCK